jgi:Fe-S-cluster containining protein
VQAGFPISKIPKDKEGNEIWRRMPELRVSELHPDTVKLEIFECMNYDKEERRCNDYSNRPEICSNFVCTDSDSEKNIEEEYTKVITEKFYKISIENT